MSRFHTERFSRRSSEVAWSTHMPRHLLATLLLALSVSTPALADVPPPDFCSEPGKSCSTAPPDYASPGVCETKKCSKPFPQPTEYDCNLCVPESEARHAKSGGGCAGCATAARAAPEPLLLLLAFLGLAAARRRRSS
jgi:MYXO-CTERM domain-containing protein